MFAQLVQPQPGCPLQVKAAAASVWVALVAGVLQMPLEAGPGLPGVLSLVVSIALSVVLTAFFAQGLVERSIPSLLVIGLTAAWDVPGSIQHIFDGVATSSVEHMVAYGASLAANTVTIALLAMPRSQAWFFERPAAAGPALA